MLPPRTPLTHPSAGVAEIPSEIAWYVGAPGLLLEITWRMCRSCEVYWVGRPTCWLCRRPADNGFPHFDAVAAHSPMDEDAELLY